MSKAGALPQHRGRTRAAPVAAAALAAALAVAACSSGGGGLSQAATSAPGGRASAPANLRSDYAQLALNVLTPGEEGAVPPGANATDQLALYDGLTPLEGNVSAADLTQYYKSEMFGLDGGTGTPESTPRPGLHILRDKWGVAHVNGDTRADVEYGAGWVTAHDRGLFIEAIRGPARIAALDVPGLDAFSLATSLRSFTPSPATEARISQQADLLAAAGAKGRQIVADVDAYVAGINAYYQSTGNKAAPWTRNDVIAASSLIGAVFGKGGGDEVRRSEFLAALDAKLGPQQGRSVFNDLRQANDPEAPTTISTPFQYEQPVSGPAPGSAIVDAGSVQAPPASPAGPATHMSNAILVGASRSATGHPLAVMGPQVGYYYPEFLMELDLHGGGIDARGAAFPGVSLYVLLGRGKDYAWSATSAETDVVDQFVEQLCNPDGSPPTRASTSYLYNGQCRPMQPFDAGTLSGTGGSPATPVRFYETVHGPVAGTVTVSGKPYAVVADRSTRGRDVMSATAFADLNTNAVHSAHDFATVMNQVEFTFNWFYLDDRDIAYFSSGRLPLRASGIDPSLPTLGTGAYDWQGFLSQAGHAQAVDPPSGVLLSWNNKPSPGFGAADDNWNLGSVQRVQLFTGLKDRNQPQDLVSVMNRAATEDLRAVEVWPLVARVLSTGAPDARTQQARDLVSAWAKAGASRLDANLDGKIDDPGAAILDAAWPRIADAVLQPALGTLTGDGPNTLASFDGRDDKANSRGSSYFGGWYGYVSKDLRTLLGDPVDGPFSRSYCGNGDLAACRASLWGALKAATNQLATSQGADAGAWRSDATGERIRFAPGALTATMRWTNRPTFQQVIEFNGHRPS